MFESLSTRLQDVFKTLRGEARLTPENDRGRAARDSARAARSGRQLQGRQGVHRPRARPGDGAGRAPQPVAVAAGRQDRPRRDAGALRRRRRRPAADDASGRASSCCSACRARARRRRPGKLAKWLTKQGRHPLLVSTDVKRPAAIQQLNVVGAEGRRCACTIRPGEMDPVARAKGAVAEADEPRASTSSSSTRRAGCTSTTS